MPERVGVVAIGRNEGERLEACLGSILRATELAVYVDSGSSDGSLARARRLGVPTVELDSTLPFTAARARNAGFARLLDLEPGIDLVQFVDGDCEVASGWIEAAAAHLRGHRDVAVVCGRRRERYPDASPYNRLVDMEWDVPAGEVDACGGDAMMRADAFREVGGYDPSLIGGEDPELCFRLREAGHRIVRLSRDMTLHDADLHRFGQWWLRGVRNGHANLEVALLHRRSPARYRWREVASFVCWGAGLPLLALAAAGVLGPWGLLTLLGYGVLALRVYRHRRRRRESRGSAWLYALACTVGKLAELQGGSTLLFNRWVRRRTTRLIEYKGPDASASSRGEE